jgi:hypothetical protein
MTIVKLYTAIVATSIINMMSCDPHLEEKYLSTYVDTKHRENLMSQHEALISAETYQLWNAISSPRALSSQTIILNTVFLCS